MWVWFCKGLNVVFIVVLLVVDFFVFSFCVVLVLFVISVCVVCCVVWVVDFVFD